MNRRRFLQAFGAAGIATAMPLSIIPHLTSYTFTRRSEIFDFGHMIGLGVQTEVNGVRLRHAVRLPLSAWKEMSGAQQEETWKLVEGMVIDMAKRRAA